jgi:hypothetical protein
MNIKRVVTYIGLYLTFGVGFFILQMGLLANLQKDWQFILVTIIIFFGGVIPLMNYFKDKIDKYLPRK